MSKEAVLELLNLSKRDLALLNLLREAQTPEAVVEIAKTYCLEFTPAELIYVMQEEQLFFPNDDELSDEQLETVVGGKNDKNNKTENYFSCSE